MPSNPMSTVLNVILCFLIGLLTPVGISFLVSVVTDQVTLRVGYVERNRGKLSWQGGYLSAPREKMAAGLKRMRRLSTLADGILFVLIAVVVAGLAYWAWSRGARWAFGVGLPAAVPGVYGAVGSFRDRTEGMWAALAGKRRLAGWSLDSGPDGRGG